LLKKKEIELRETVGIYNRQFADLESKMMEHEASNEELKLKTNRLQTTLDKTKAEKLKTLNDLKKAHRESDVFRRELEEIKEEQRATMRGMSADIGKKDSHLREAVQRYTRTIANLETRLEEETQSKLELEDRLESARSELEDKQKQTQEMVQRHAKATKELENKFGKAFTEREELKIELDHTKKGMVTKEYELNASLESVKQEHSEFRDLSFSARGELQEKEQQISDMRQDIEALRTKLKSKSSEYKEMKMTFERNESELKQRKEQINDLVSKYTDRIAELEAKLDEHSDAVTNSDDKVETVQAQSERKDQKIRELVKSVAEMEAKLEAANRSKESAKLKSESLSKDLDEKESRLRTFEVEKIELETKLHTQARSKDEARAKMSELSSRLERKEREVREVSDRYKIYVMELESKLDQDTDTKHNLQLEIDKLRNNLDSASEVSSEALELRHKVSSLEMTIASSDETTASLQSKLQEASKARKSIDAALQKANSEKAEVIAALEGVINEVQNREDEIESLSELLQRRDEELQHAKIIATKALASAKDIQMRYKDKTEGRHSDLMGRMHEVSDSVDKLTAKNEQLQRKVTSLERDLRDRSLECKRLKDQLKQIDAKQMRENNIKDDISAISTQSTEITTFSNQAISDEGVDDDHRQLQFNAPLSMDSDSFSPTNRASNTTGDFVNLNDDGFSNSVDFPSIDEQYSKDSIENSQNGESKWQDFDSETGSGFDSVTEQESTRSRRSVERDALRKYVRQRYSKRGEKS
jgi:chromosome segregation ATPase